MKNKHYYKVYSTYIYFGCLVILFITFLIMNIYSTSTERENNDTKNSDVVIETDETNLIVGEVNDKIENENDSIETQEILEIINDVKTTVQEYDYCDDYPVDEDFGLFKSYTDYKKLARNSRQWELQQQAYTDENGLRKIGDAYLVALGSYYGKELGTRYTVTLSNGNSFCIILCDFKNDIHTDSSNRECLVNCSVLEFYVDSSALPKQVKTMGTISAIPFFSGSVVSIEKNN